MKITPLTPTIGALIDGVDLNNIASQQTYDQIKQALWQHHVIFFRDQPLQPEAYKALGRQFGEIEQHEFFPHVDGHPEIQMIAHKGYEQPETDRWHTDVTFRAQPSLVTILRAMELPSSGGDTLWASTAAAFDALGEHLQSMLLGLNAEHDLPYRMRKIDFYRRVREGKIGGMKANADAGEEQASHEHEFRMIEHNPPMQHPAVIHHPITGRLSLFVNSIWTKKLLGIHEDLGDSLLRMLYEWVKKPEFQVRFQWQPDSIAIWDNFATQHFAVFDYAPQHRSMQRMTAGEALPWLDRARVPERLRPRHWDSENHAASSQESANLALFQRFFAAFSNADVDAVCECISEDFEWRLPKGPERPYGQVVRGHDGFRQAFASERGELIKRAEAWNENVMVNGDQIAQRYRIKATLPDGQVIDTYGFDYYTIKDGKIVSKDAYWKAFS